MPKIMLNNFKEIATQKFNRENKRFSISKISEQTGLNRRTVTAYLRNEVTRSNTDVVFKLCEWANCTLEEFWRDEFQEKDDNSPEYRTLLPA